jgi:hypothetical protein
MQPDLQPVLIVSPIQAELREVALRDDLEVSKIQMKAKYSLPKRETELSLERNN